MSQTAAFQQKLSPLADFLSNPLVTEIAINCPGEMWVLYQGSRYMQRIKQKELTYDWLRSLANLIAFSSQQSISAVQPLLSATMHFKHDIYRVQVVCPPAVMSQTIAICIRKPAIKKFSLSDYQRQHAFDSVNIAGQEKKHQYQALISLYRQQAWCKLLRLAVTMKLNIVISAGTNTGKTTFLNALMREIHEQERIVTIEDTREIMLRQANAVHLLYSRSEQDKQKMGPVRLLETVLRLSPDRIMMGELRGDEAYVYLELLNSGHTGSMTTIHAESPDLMFDRLAQMVMRFNPHCVHHQVVAYAKSLIQVVIQCQMNNQGERTISAIWLNQQLFQE